MLWTAQQKLSKFMGLTFTIIHKSIEWSTLGKGLSGRDTRNYNQHAGKLVGKSMH